MLLRSGTRINEDIPKEPAVKKTIQKPAKKKRKYKKRTVVHHRSEDEAPLPSFSKKSTSKKKPPGKKGTRAYTNSAMDNTTNDIMENRINEMETTQYVMTNNDVINNTNNAVINNTNNDVINNTNNDVINNTNNEVINNTNNSLLENIVSDFESINNDSIDSENSIFELDIKNVLDPINLDDDTEDVDEDPFSAPGVHICNEISQWLYNASRDHRIREEEEMYEEPNVPQRKRKREANVCKDISTKDLCRMLKSCNNLSDFIDRQKEKLKRCLNCIVIYRKCRIMVLLKEHEDKFHPGRSCRLCCLRKHRKKIVTIDLTTEDNCESRDEEDEMESNENNLLAIIKVNLFTDRAIPITDFSELKNLTQDIILGINNASSARSSSPNTESAISDSDNLSNIPIPTTTRGQSKTINANSDQGTLNPQPGTSGTQAAGIHAQLFDAPVFYPTIEEFNDPVAYFEKIMPIAAKYGLCKVVAPDDFYPTFDLDEDIEFNVFNQYIARGFKRWGPVTRELCTILDQAASQNVLLDRSPLVAGMEVDLVKMFHAVKRNGGLKALNKKKWYKISKELNYRGLSNHEDILHQIYTKYLVPYDSLAKRGRQECLNKMEVLWHKMNKKKLKEAMNPLRRQKLYLEEDGYLSDEENEDSSDGRRISLLKEVEDCVVQGSKMDVDYFKAIARNASKMHFAREVNPAEVEISYWKIVESGNEHICVNYASVDTVADDHGFTNHNYEPDGTHLWNLKLLFKNTGNVLRHLGPVTGVTVPILHISMVYSTNYWHRDPHGLSWIDFMHEGLHKIWYGISDEESYRFRKAVENFSPTSCQNKSIWLPPNTTMISPKLLLENGVSLSRVVQNPGEFIIVFPKSYSCSISTGYTVSESVYFATNSWVNSIHQVFQELRDNCEPTKFSLEQLLIDAVKDPSASSTTLQLLYAKFVSIISDELDNRTKSEDRGLVPLFRERRNIHGSLNKDDRCEICRTFLYLSRVKGIHLTSNAVCISHALRIIDVFKISKSDVSGYVFEIFFTNTELKDILNLAKTRVFKGKRNSK